MNDEPLIHTSAGNVPVSSLTYATSWEDTAAAVVFVEEYRLAGEIVKRSVHALSKTGIAGESVVGGVN